MKKSVILAPALMTLAICFGASLAIADTYPILSGPAGVTDGDTIRMPTATLLANGQTSKAQNVKIR